MTTWNLYIPDTLGGAFNYNENTTYDGVLPYDCISSNGHITFWYLQTAN